ncbi:MAG: hypothetical protein ACI9VT_004126 [Psychroserpens sp.]|jgi:hypothetical protein
MIKSYFLFMLALDLFSIYSGLAVVPVYSTVILVNKKCDLGKTDYGIQHLRAL